MMSHYCTFCQMEHSSSGCYHPGHTQLKAKDVEIERLKECLAAREEISGDLRAEIERLRARIEELEYDLEDKLMDAIAACEDKDDD